MESGALDYVEITSRPDDLRRTSGPQVAVRRNRKIWRFPRSRRLQRPGAVSSVIRGILSQRPAGTGSCTCAGIVLASLRSAAVFGVEAYPVHIEVDVAFGLPHFTMVGLPDATVRESRDRVRSAIRNSGFEFPHHRITVNLAPADVRKAGSSFDLPIALGLLATSGRLPAAQSTTRSIVGELSLDGGINGIRGVLPIAVAARRLGLKRLLLPPQNAARRASSRASTCVSPARCLRPSTRSTGRTKRSERLLLDASAAARRTSGDGDLCRRSRATARAPGARGCRGRRSQSAAEGPARSWQDDDGAPAGIDPAAAHLRRGAGVYGDSLGGRHAAARRWRCSASARFARRITPCPTSHSSAAAPSRALERSRWRTTVCCFSTKCRSSIGVRSRCCVSRSKKAA